MSDPRSTLGSVADAAEFMVGPGGERRTEDRLQKILFARVHGRHSAFRAMVLNVSRRGALVTITDPDFEVSEDQADLGLAGLRVAAHFGEGLRLEILEPALSVKADVVRLSEGRREGQGVFWLGCRFQRPLEEMECEALGVPRTAIAPAPSDETSAPVVVVPGARPREAQRPARVRIQEGGPKMSARELLELMAGRHASDLHVKAGSPVRIRVDGALVEAGDRALAAADARALMRELLTPEQVERFDDSGDLDTAHALDGVARFRVRVLRTRGEIGLAIHRVPEAAPGASELGLSPVCMKLAERTRGLVLVAGPTGSGKSTTLASMIQHINRSRACHIVTLEDPIGFLHTEERAHITQREIGSDTDDFAPALKRAMRQDPDVILVGELRDLETMALAVTAAETGRLVFATLPARSAVLTVDRLVDVFPSARQRQIRMQLADALEGIICQTLVPRNGGGVAVAQEILVATPGVRTLVREGKSSQMANLMQMGAKEGMQTLEDSLNDLVERRVISRETALARANHPSRIG